MSFFTHTNATVPSLTPPPTPCKRSRDEYEGFSKATKRTQFHQIHSQEHISTVAMMMEAARHQKYLPEVERTESTDNVDEPEHKPQKPFWPMISRVKQS